VCMCVCVCMYVCMCVYVCVWLVVNAEQVLYRQRERVRTIQVLGTV